MILHTARRRFTGVPYPQKTLTLGDVILPPMGRFGRTVYLVPESEDTPPVDPAASTFVVVCVIC